MKAYLDLVRTVLNTGKIKGNRTGTRALTIAGAMIQHDLSTGFPLLTTKKVAFKSVKVELEFFIKGITDKRWLQERGCTIWNEWCSPKKIPAGLNEKEKKEFALKENDLGPIYGAQWRNFGNALGSGVDQLSLLINKVKEDPEDRRLLVSAWNPLELSSMALPPCHVLFHLVVIGDTLNLTWFQRSCDLMLGIPFNLASYALLLHLICLETQLIPGVVSGMLSDVHIYENHVDGARLQITRNPLALPNIKTTPFSSIFSWEHQHSVLEKYEHLEKIPFPIAV